MRLLSVCAIGFIFLLNQLALPKIPEYTNLHIVGDIIVDEYFYEYGSITYANGNTDGILIVYEYDTMTRLNVFIHDNNGLERFTYLALTTNDNILVVCEEYTYTQDYLGSFFSATKVMCFDLEGVKTDQTSFDKKFKYKENHNYHLILVDNNDTTLYLNSDMVALDELPMDYEYQGRYQSQYQGDLYINGTLESELKIDYPGNYEIEIVDGTYSFSYTVTVHPEVEIVGEMYGEYYLDSVKVISKGDIQINSVSYQSGTEIVVPGLYVINIFGVNDYIYSDSVSLLPEITYSTGDYSAQIIQNMQVEEPIYIYSNAISMVLDGEIYQSEIIEESGKHTLTAYCLNDMFFVIDFYLVPYVTGVEDGQSYETVDIYIFGNAYLDQEEVSGNITVSSSGEHLLETYLDGVLYESISFTIYEDETEVEEPGWMDGKIGYVFLAVIVVGGYLILRKK